MNYLDYINKMARLLDSIEKGHTGCADCLAEKLGISRRTVFRYIEELRDSGAQIRYSKTTNSYMLENEFSLKEKILKT